MQLALNNWHLRRTISTALEGKDKFDVDVIIQYLTLWPNALRRLSGETSNRLGNFGYDGWDQWSSSVYI